jgi:hypothetical protein
MDKTNEVSSFLGNLQKALKVSSLGEIDKTLSDLVKKKRNNQSEIEYVLKIVCEEYNITRETLLKKNTKGIHNDAKQIAYCLLHFSPLELKIRCIAKDVFGNWPNSVHIGIKRLKSIDSATKIKQDLAFVKTFEKLQEKLIIYTTTA